MPQGISWRALQVVCWSAAAVCLFGAVVGTAAASDIEARHCDDLLKLAEGLRRDMRTVDLMLGSAIDSGDMERIQAYRLKKDTLKKQLESAMKSIRAAECVGGG